MPYPPTFNEILDPTYPPDTQQANQLGLDIRSFKTDVIQRVALLSGTFANRPTPDSGWGGTGYGWLYFTTDTNKVYQWNGASWVDVSSSFLGSFVVSRTTLIASTFTSTGPNTFYTTPVAITGLYRVTFDLDVTSNLTATDSFQVSLGYTDESSTAHTFYFVGVTVSGYGCPNVIANTGAHYFGTHTLALGPSQIITYTIGKFNGQSLGAPTYNLRFCVEFLSQ